MTKPKKLQKGDTLAIISPSWGGPFVFPHIYELGIKNLEKLGFKIKEYPSARNDDKYNYNNPEFRAKDINDAFADPEVNAIIASIGGDYSVRILPFLNLEIIKKNPKIIMGYSDTTTITTYLNQQGLVTFNGPSVMAGFSQLESLEEKFNSHIQTIIFDNPSNYNYTPYEYYSNGYPNWSDKTTVGQTNRKIKNNGWKWLQGNTIVQGELFGGCIEVFEFIKSTIYYPEPNFWKNKIFFLETSEEKPSPTQVMWMLRNYGTQGVYNQISALLIGRPADYTDAEKAELDESIIKVVKQEFKNDRLPIVTNMDFGHTDPQWILPQGIKAEVNCIQKEFKLIEKIFQD